MHLAYVPPWWLAWLLAALAAGAAFLEYRRPLAPLSGARRATLAALRTSVVAVLILLLLRPMVYVPPAGPRDSIVPVLVDVSRSMRVADAEGRARIDRAAALLEFDVLPALATRYRTVLLTVGDGLAPGSLRSLVAGARQTDLRGALAQVSERFRGQRVAGVVLLSDGADTGLPEGGGGVEIRSSFPVFPIGVGARDGLRDREVVSVAAGARPPDRASVDVQVVTTSHGFGREPFELRLLANGKPTERRRVAPSAEGSPVEERFTVIPDSTSATVYTAEIAADPREAVTENNSRSVVIAPSGRKRRLLVVEGAPGFEHSFITRAWAADPGLEVDSVVRKGRDAGGHDTFFVQAAAPRAAALSGGFPSRREDLYAYDALVVANVGGDFFTRAQLTMVGDFVAERGGGLLVTGGRSFAPPGFIGTPVEAVLPVELADRRGGLARATHGSRGRGAPNQLVVTEEGEIHPITRLGAPGEETRKQWEALPALAGTAPLGPARPAATVLAVASAPGGGTYPVVAVQRYGRGRSMVFAGEASWRWRMMAASTNRSHDLFWRQAARWLAAEAPDPVSIAFSGAPEPGDLTSIEVEARDASFAPASDARVEATIESPGGGEQPLVLRSAAASSGRLTSDIRLDRPGLYHLRATATRGTAPLGRADRWMLVGGVDREFADPRLNEGFLRRLARDTGGRYLPAADALRVVSTLQEVAPADPVPEGRDLWHEPWVMATVIVLLSAEWILRRRWGLR